MYASKLMEKVVKVLEKEEDKVLIVEEGALKKSSTSSGTILVSGSYLSLLVLLRLV